VTVEEWKHTARPGSERRDGTDLTRSPSASSRRSPTERTDPGPARP
jgi:hypothetical protein